MNVESKVTLRAEIDPRINFAMQQNDVPVIKSVHIENLSSSPLHDLILRIKSEPQFALPWEERIDLVPENSTYNLNAVDLELSPKFLGELTERVRGLLGFELFHQSDVKRMLTICYISALFLPPLDVLIFRSYQATSPLR